MNHGPGMVAVDAVADEAADHLVREFAPLKIILFGSCAAGRTTADSDIDLLVVMPDGTDRRQAAIQMHRALRDLPAPKDILVTTPGEITSHGHARGSVLSEALRQGKVLYERN